MVPAWRIALFALNFLVMVFLPLILGWFIARRRSISWRLFGIGAASFVLAQLLHVPFNFVVAGNLLATVKLDSEGATLLINAAFIGLSAGLFEEGARYLAYRFWANDARTWGRGLMMGAGHGGAESILLGVLGAINFTILLGYTAGYFRRLVPPDQAPLIFETVDVMATLPWFETLFGALERIFALCIQLALSLLVMQVFVRGKIRWLILAVAWHSIIDAAVVLAVGTGGVYAAEALVGVSAILSLLIVLGLKEPEPEIVLPDPLPEPQPIRPLQPQIANEKLEESRYL